MKNQPSLQRSSERSLSPLDYAYRLLARRAYTEQALGEKMLAKGFTEAVVARTVARLLEQGYLNDAHFAVDHAERLRKRGFGREQIRARLAHSGLEEETIENALLDERSSDEWMSAKRFLASRFTTDALKQPQTYAQAFRLLLRRGYTQDIVEDLLGEQPREAEEE